MGGGMGGGGFGGRPATPDEFRQRNPAAQDAEIDRLSDLQGSKFNVLSSVLGESTRKEAGWSSAGGLSLRFELPQEGRALHFSKVGGGPRLSIAVRPQKTWETVGGWVWTAVWIAVAVWLVSLVRRADGRQRILDLAPLALALVGAACYLLIPGDGRTLGILIWVVVAVWFALSGRRRTPVDGAASRWC